MNYKVSKGKPRPANTNDNTIDCERTKHASSIEAGEVVSRAVQRKNCGPKEAEGLFCFSSLCFLFVSFLLGSFWLLVVLFYVEWMR